MQTQRFFEERWYRPRGAFGLAEDTAQILSPASFREFCVPYDRRLYETFCGKNGDRMMHMCGKSSHLHRSLVEDLKVTEFVLFGYVVPPKVAAENLGGKMRLWGNLNPMLLLEGTPEEVKAAALECLDALAPCGGLLLGDGANVCPGTPLRNLEEVTEAAKEFGLPKIEGLRRRK
jgi:uroporphyrinogen decarboxylase